MKVSTIEQTASSVDANGGKGNPALVSWDFGKEINVTLEDALFSPASMAIMFGNGSVEALGSTEKIEKVAMARIAATAADTTVAIDAKGGRKTVKVMNDGAFNAADGIKGATDKDGKDITAANFATQTAGDKVFVHYEAEPESTKVININAETFPGTYYITGDTYCRSDVTGEDDFFQFVIPKAKMQAENTITLEAEGDPSVFNLNLKVLRPESGPMMQLIQYNLKAATGEDGE